MLRLPLVDRFKFFIERQFVKGAGFQLLIVAVVIGLISLAGGIALRLTESDTGLVDAIWWAFLRLTDPGYLGDDEGTWARTVSTFLTVSGYVVFMGTLVAIMTRWLIARMLEFERGLTPVAMHNHIVILGWTNRTLPLLRELIGKHGSRDRIRAAFGMRRLRAVVLSEDVSPAHFQAIRADPALRRSARDIVLRYGSVLEEAAIHRAACLNAAAVILPGGYGRGSELVSADVEITRALLSIDTRAAGLGQPPPLMIAEIRDSRRVKMLTSAYRGPLEVIPTDDTINRLLVQTMLHPGLAAFLGEVLASQTGNEFRLAEAGRLAGASLREAQTRLPRAIVLGLLRQQGPARAAMLCPPSETRIEQQDLLVLLARSVADTQPQTGARGSWSVGERRPKSGRRAHAGRLHLLLLGWSERVPGLLDELASYPALQVEIDLLSIVDVQLREREIERYSKRAAGVSVRHVETDYLLTGELERLDLAGFDSIFLLSSDRLDSAEEADARVIVGHRIIEAALAEAARKPQLLVELSDPANQGLIDSKSVETLVSPMLVSHLMAQVALRREIRLVFDELFTEGGAEIVFRPAADYHISTHHSFAALEAKVAERGDVLLGLQPADQMLMLNPAREQVFEMHPDDRLCVLTRT